MGRMSNKKFRTILVPVVSLMAAIATIATINANQYSASLDFALGRGQKHVEQINGISKEDVTFYEHNYKDATSSRQAACDVVEKVEEQGATLLKNKNNALPIAKQSKVTPFGYRFIDPFFGGTGSANINPTDDFVIKAEKALGDYFALNADVVNKMKASTPVKMVCDDGNDPTDLSEYDGDIYTGLEDSCKDSVGIIYIARPGTEGYDLNSTKPYEDGTMTQLELTTREKAMIAFSKAHCSKTIVLLITPNIMEVSSLQNDDGIDAILWPGLPGASGYKTISRILDGEVNPSGKTSDLWYADFEADPTYQNHTTSPYSNAVKGGPSCFMEYEEGIYFGYRYYETRYAEDNKFSVFGQTKGYDDAVTYPFGFGLNYEDEKITQDFDSISYQNGKISVHGTIHNESSRDVDEVVQIYFGGEYHQGGIEKATKNLLGFEKYNVKAGEDKKFTLTFDEEELVSYDHKGIYTDNGSYVLEAGKYSFYLGKDSHNSWGEKSINIDETKVYASSSKKGTAVGKRATDKMAANNLLNTLNTYQERNEMTTLSRGDMAGTYPTSAAEKPMSDKVLESLKVIDYKTDPRVGNVEGSKFYHAEGPTEKANNGVTLSALRGLDYDDPLWEDLLDNLDYESADISSLITYGLYQTAKVESIGAVSTNDHDGTAGLTATWGGNDALAGMFGTKSNPVTACCYPCAPIQAATFNRSVMRKMGEMIGEEALTNNVSGWYAPGLNLHRSPYGGRNFEYYSEDPVLSGEIAAVTVSGAFTKGGLYAYIKHFALNETDVDRSSVAVWSNEQACRELYFKAFEICVKKAEGEITYYNSVSKKKETKTVNACRGLMTSMNYIGVESPTNSYNLLTTLLRDEWDFEGMVITDFTSGTYRDKNVGYRVGNDIWMAMKKFDLDLSDPTAKWAARNAVKNITYVVVNSNAYENVAPGAYAWYEMSPWMVGVIAFDVTLGVLALGGVLWMVLRELSEKKKPDLYNKD